jgi:glycosyltransferase involved in cell wall biosynthesis
MRGMIPEGEGVVYRAPGADFVAAVDGWLRDETERAKAAAAARRAVEERCQWERCAGALEAAIERMVAAGPRSVRRSRRAA